MSKILIDNDFSLMTSYNIGSKEKKFNLTQLKMICYFISELNKFILNLKYDLKDYQESLINYELSKNEIDQIVIDKTTLRKKCFNYRISDKKLYDLIYDCNIKFQSKTKQKFFYLFQSLSFTQKEIIYMPTFDIIDLLHCDSNHFEIEIEKILNFKSINSLLFYLWFKANKFIITRYNKKLVISIYKLKEYYLSNRQTKHFIAEIIKPSVKEYNLITNEKTKIRTIKVGNQITSIEFLLK